MEQTRQDLPMSIKQLDAAVGLTELKQTVHQLYDMCEFDRARGYAADRRCPNYLFVGNPGTGKTSAARGWGAILRDCGILLSGHVHTADRSTLIGSHIGETAKLVKGACRSAIHGVLFIDEAYALVTQGSSNDFGHEAIATLIKEMEDHRNELVVILAGYPELMDEFMRTNPGLQSRFTETIHFKDFSDDELVEIGRRYCRKHGFNLSEDGKKAFLTTMYKRRYSERFGNARDAEQVLEDAFRRKAALFINGESHEDMKTIDDSCFPSEIKDRNLAQNAAKRLNQMIGLKKAKRTLQVIIDKAVYTKQEIDLGFSRQEDNGLWGHYCFVGNPGTGKTTVARLFGEILYSSGITKTDTFIEATREDLVAGYCGQTAIKTKTLCEKAYGGILFIDEAYSIVQNSSDSFGLEALATLLKEMEDNRDKLIVILAGYKKEMETFLSANSGMRSRISSIVEFDDYSEAELISIFKNIEDSNGVSCDADSQTLIRRRIHEMYVAHNDCFGNGRAVRGLFEDIHAHMMSRVVRLNLTDRAARHTIIAEDVA